MAAWPRVFLLTAVLGVGLIAYAAFRLVTGLPGLAFDLIDTVTGWANFGLCLLVAAWFLGVGREAIAAMPRSSPSEPKGNRSFAQVMIDAGFWTEGKKP